MGLKSQEPKAYAKKTGKKVGGQPGHNGSGLSLTSEPDQIISHSATKCAGCALADRCSSRVVNTRYVTDIVIKTQLKAHQQLERVCPSGEKNRGVFPERMTARMQQYGENLSALVVTLNTYGMMSIQRIQDVLSGGFEVPISTGTIRHLVTRCSEQVGTALDRIKEQLTTASLLHFDETGLSVDPKLHWVHSL